MAMAAPRAPRDSMGESAKAVFVAQQLHFANTLAGNDPKLRVRAMKKLRKYLLARSSGNTSFTKDDFMRIWKGLFYCMWMSDKPLIQEELAEQISHLIHCFGSGGGDGPAVNAGLEFIESFFCTIMVEWYGIDYHRMDKFQMFVRRFLRQSFTYCKNKKWSDRVVTGLCDVFKSTVLSSQYENEFADTGLIMHFVDIFVEELAKVGAGVVPKNVILQFLEPFALHLTEQQDFRLQQLIRDKVFFCLIKQSPGGMEYEEKFEAWKRAGFPGRSWKDMVFVGNDDSRAGVKIKDLDPRAGKVNVYLPHLEFDAIGVAELLQKIARESSNDHRVKFIEKIAKKFQDLAEDIYPLTLNITTKFKNINKYKFSKQKIDNAVGRLIRFNANVEKYARIKEGGEKRKKKTSSSLKKQKKMKLDKLVSVKEKKNFRKQENLEADEYSDGEHSDSYISDSSNVEMDEVKLSGILSKKKNLLPSKRKIGKDIFCQEGQLDDKMSAEDIKDSVFDVNRLVSKNKKRKKKISQNIFTWDVSEIPSIKEKICDSQEICVNENESKNMSEDTMVSPEVDSADYSVGSSPKNALEASVNVEVLQYEVNKEDRKRIIIPDVNTVNQPPKMESETATYTDEIAVLQENGLHEECSTGHEVVTSINRKIMTPLKKSARRKSNVSDSGQLLKEKDEVINTPVTRSGKKAQISLTQSYTKRKLNKVINSDRERDDKCIEEADLSDDNTVTLINERDLLSIRELQSTRRTSRACVVPDREIPCLTKDNEELHVPENLTISPLNSKDNSLEESPSMDSNSNGVLCEKEKAVSTPRRITSRLRGKNSSLKKRVSLRTATPSSTKKVNIALQMNRSQAVSEYVAAVKQSPSVPHDANKKPCKGVLKRTSIQSPLNPFYVPPKGLK